MFGKWLFQFLWLTLMHIFIHRIIIIMIIMSLVEAMSYVHSNADNAITRRYQHLMNLCTYHVYGIYASHNSATSECIHVKRSNGLAPTRIIIIAIGNFHSIRKTFRMTNLLCVCVHCLINIIICLQNLCLCLLLIYD